MTEAQKVKTLRDALYWFAENAPEIEMKLRAVIALYDSMDGADDAKEA